MPADERQLAHMVFFTLQESNDKRADELVALCHKYLSNHPGATYFSAGRRGQEFTREVNDQEYDVALHVVFESKEAHDAYQESPLHLKFIEAGKENWKKVRVFDSWV